VRGDGSSFGKAGKDGDGMKPVDKEKFVIRHLADFG
jgi:hypothetical protein